MSVVILSNVNNMAPRRASKIVKTLKKVDYKALILNDVLCPICRSILIEPVTLPCNHGFCSSCFDCTMENANLVCPLCRIRIGSWLRKARKEANLVNEELWNAIKDKFPQQVKNKLSGIDENFEEDPEIIVSYPGEIRKEYQIQKQKEDEEFRKKCEADIKASEDLIRKIKEAEDYEKAIMEEKLKLDEQVAKKLAEEFALISPSTSKAKQISKKLGPMDKFLKQENETVTSLNMQKRPTNNFTTKEYTCRVLCLDSNKKKPENVSRKKVFSPIIKKKIQQIQKIVDTDVTSDGSDCIESELRYFKPIDHRVNPPSVGKPPIRVPTKKPHKNTAATILSPSGLINFNSNFLESAFARISFTIPTSSNRKNSSPQGVNSSPSTSNLKRYRSDEDICSPSKRKNNKTLKDQDKKSPILNNHNKTNRTKRQLFGKSSNIFEVETSSSPPFYGFENSDSKNKSNIKNPLKKNGLVNITDDEKSKKLIQEMADLEFAKKLQDEFNRNAHYTRSSRRSTGSSKRQATLDEIMKTPYRVK